jgi:hypothetical protein
MALRFHGQETNVVPRARLAASFRLMLERPQLADLVIPDLARWQDWSAMERVVTLFKDAKDDTLWVRVPVINYLRHCPDPKAKQYVEELRAIDPARVKQAEQFVPFVAATAAPDATPDPAATAPAPPPKPKKAAVDYGPKIINKPAAKKAAAEPSAAKPAAEQPAAKASTNDSASTSPSAAALGAGKIKEVAQNSLAATSAASKRAAPSGGVVGVWLGAGVAGTFLLFVFLLIFRSSHKPINV